MCLCFAILLWIDRLREEWILTNTNARHVITIANPIILPLPKLEPNISPAIQSDKKLLLGVGRLTHQKQFKHLLESFAAIANKHPDWNLAIVGEGEEKSALAEHIKKLDIGNRSQLIGRVGNISEWYDAADAFALTSITEGFPNALIEAMAHGVACISYDCLTGPAEIIEHRKNGLLVESNNLQKLTKALDGLLESKELQQRIANQAINIIPLLDPEIIFKEWEDEFHRLLAA